MSGFSKEYRNEVYKKAIKRFGTRLQTMVAIEEMAELTKEIIKVERNPLFNFNPENDKDIIDEIADVKIMTEQLELIFGAPQVQDRVDYKILRLEKRLKENG